MLGTWIWSDCTTSMLCCCTLIRNPMQWSVVTWDNIGNREIVDVWHLWQWLQCWALVSDWKRIWVLVSQCTWVIVETANHRKKTMSPANINFNKWHIRSWYDMNKEICVLIQLRRWKNPVIPHKVEPTTDIIIPAWILHTSFWTWFMQSWHRNVLVTHWSKASSLQTANGLVVKPQNQMKFLTHTESITMPFRVMIEDQALSWSQVSA